MAEKQIHEIPASLRELYDRGIAAMQKNNFDYAVALFQTILKQEPAFYPCREALRAAQFKSVATKASFFRRFVGSASSLTKGQLALRSNPRDALVIAEEVLSENPSNKDAHELLADAARALHLPKTAVLSLEVAFKANPQDRKLADKLAETLISVGQNARAEKIYRDLLSANPRDPLLNEKLKNAMASRTLAEGGYEGLADGSGSYRDILRDKTQAVVLEQEQRTVKDADVASQLIADAQARLALEPENLRIMRQIAELYVQKKDFDAALTFFERMQAAGGVNDPQIAKAILDTRRARFDVQESALDPAAPDFETRREALQQERRTFLLEDARRRADEYPSDLQIRLELGELYLQAGRVGEAIAELQKAQNNPSRRIAAMSLLAQCFARRGMLDLAARKLQEALKEKVLFDDEKKDLHYQLGSILEGMGKLPEALDQFKIIYEQDIGFRDVMTKVDAGYAALEAQRKG